MHLCYNLIHANTPLYSAL